MRGGAMASASSSSSSARLATSMSASDHTMGDTEHVPQDAREHEPMDADDELEVIVQALSASAVANEEDTRMLAAAVTLKSARTQGQQKELRKMCTIWDVNRKGQNRKERPMGELLMELQQAVLEAWRNRSAAKHCDDNIVNNSWVLQSTSENPRKQQFQADSIAMGSMVPTEVLPRQHCDDNIVNGSTMLQSSSENKRKGS